MTSKTISTSSVFCKLANYEVNAGVSDTFPWLSGIAKQFDKYKLTRLNLKFIPYASTTTPGTISMFFVGDSRQYNPSTIS